MPLRCWKFEGSRITCLQGLILLPCLLILTLWVGGGRTMIESEVKEMRYEQEHFSQMLS